MKRIIVPTDFSQGAFNALINAIEISKVLDANIQVIHAYSMPPTGSAVMVDITDILKKNADEELENLKTEVLKLAEAKDLKITYRSLHGSVIDVVNRVTRDDGADLVIMGTQGASGITEKWLGSNTAAAARNIDIPLIAIPADFKYKPFSRLLFATDMKIMKETSALEFIGDFSQKCDAEVKFIHIRTEGMGSDDSNVEEYKNQIDSIFHKDTKTTFAYLYEDDVDKGIAETIQMENPDLVIVVHHEYGFIEGLFHTSVSKSIINKAALPILVLKG